MTPILSIIIPCYNHGKYILETIESIEIAKKSTHYHLEIIILDDGSNELNTINVLEHLKSNHFNVVSQQNGGLGNARNNAIKLAKGKYILPIDSDNRVLVPYLKEAIEILEANDDISVVYGNAIFFGEKSGDWVVGKYNLQKLMLGNYIDACAVYRKSVWQFLGGYDEKMPKMGTEDWDFWLNCSFNNYKFYYLNLPCFEYRVEGNSMIHTFTKLDFNLINEYIERKYSRFISFKSINDKFGINLDNNLELIVKHVSFKNLIKSFFKKITIKLNF